MRPSGRRARGAGDFVGGRISGVSRVEAVGIDVPSRPVADTFGPAPVG
ncbi:hypothetical protein ACFVW1_09675 [Streptomyces olivochromogenes]